MNKLKLDSKKIAYGRNLAEGIVKEVEQYIKHHTTVTVERAVLRLYGIDGVDEVGTPLVNVIVNELLKENALNKGAAYWLINAVLELNMTPQQIAEAIGRKEIEITKLPLLSDREIEEMAKTLAEATLTKIAYRRSERERMLAELGKNREPLLYVIVATGNIYEDAIQAKVAVRQGADIIAVIRSTGQSLLDYVPYGITTSGFGGTYATQANFQIMRDALDEVGQEVGRYIYLTNYCSGLCMPEIAAMGAIERLDMMLNDSMYGIIFRDINMKRTFIDQFFSRLINAYAGVIINTGEDNYLTTADAIDSAHTVLASNFINEQFAFLCGLKAKQIGLGHAFEIDSKISNGFLYEVAHASLIREVFPDSPIKYMPPTKYMTGNIFRGHVQDTLFNVCSIITGQSIQLLGMLTEASHTPLLQDRFLSIEAARYIFNNMRNISDEIKFREDGFIVKRAAQVLNEAVEFLEKIAKVGLMQSIENGWFADIKRNLNGGKGLDGVIVRDKYYLNPFFSLMLNEVRKNEC